MSSILRPAVTGLSLLIGASASAFAYDVTSYPRSLADGENSVIEHGPGNARGALVGGGRVIASGSGEETRLQHLDGGFAQQPLRGLVAMSVGSGENSSIVYVPASPRG